MSDGWLSPDKYEHVPILGCTGPGTYLDSAWKFVGHTTESRPGSIDAVLDLFHAQPCYCPQFVLDPLGTHRRVQCIPWTWSGAALRGGGPCGMETNRWRAVQVEICCYSAQIADWPDDAYGEVADFICDLIRDGCPLNLDNVPDYPSMTGVLATQDSPYRLNGDAFRLFDGLGAHVIVGCNDHWDCGLIDMQRIADLAKANLAGGGYVTPPAAPPPPAPAPVNPGYVAAGMEGGIVQFLQQLLIGIGYDCGPTGDDGIFGAGTEAAVRAFQADEGLDVDGIVGPVTKAALAARYGNGGGVPGPDVPAFPGRYLVLQVPILTGDDARVWQQRMSDRGWSLSVDGGYGPETANVCRRFQTEKRLDVDDVVGPLTWAAAWSAPIT